MIDKKATCKLKLRRSDLVILIAIVVLGLVAALSYFFLDARIISSLCQGPNNWHNNYWVEAFKYLGKTWVPIWLLLVWIRVSNRLRPALTGLLALLLLVPIVPPLKVLVGRPRPREVIAASSGAQENNGLDQSLSFPSGDTATVFAVATALAAFVGWYLIPVFFTLAAGIGFLRVAVLAHYPSDVFAGAAVGIFCGWLALQIGRRWVSLESPRFNWCRGTAVLGVILIPFLIGLFEGVNDLLIFLKTYVVLTAGIYLIAKAVAWSKCLGGHNTCNH